MQFALLKSTQLLGTPHILLLDGHKFGQLEELRVVLQLLLLLRTSTLTVIAVHLDKLIIVKPFGVRGIHQPRDPRVNRQIDIVQVHILLLFGRDQTLLLLC